MRFRRLGRTGLPISALSLGAWVNFGRSVGRGEARELIALAHDQGVSFFDNAESYGQGEGERIMGDALADLRLARDSFCVSSKVFFGAGADPRPTQRGLSRKHVIEACHQALRRLRVEYLDFFLCHRPDPEVPIEETVLAMDLLVRQGKILYWGTSEWPAEVIVRACGFAADHSLVAPSLEQAQYNLFARARVEREYAPLCRDLGLGLTTWSPLASGLLSGKYRDAGAGGRLREADYAWLDNHLEGATGRARSGRVGHLVAMAADLGCTPAQLAIAWCLGNPDVSTVILGASSTDQLRDNLGALAVLDALMPAERDGLADSMAD
ncbi:MAG: aldo/keto reductase [Xanthomonadales bacterium]|nr:aldo/keto reductase [Xanthomonadales bacterium]